MLRRRSLSLVIGGLLFAIQVVFGGAQTSIATASPACQVWVASGVGGSYITVVDSWTSGMGTFSIGGAHANLVFNRSGTKVFVTMQNSGVKMVDVATYQVDSVAAGGFQAGQGSFRSIAASPTANLILVAADDGAGNVNHYTSLNSETGTAIGTIFPMSWRSAAIVFGPTGTAYSAESDVPGRPDRLDVIDATSPLVTSQVNIGSTISETFTTAAIATPAGQSPLLFVGAFDGATNYFSAFSLNSGAALGTVSLSSIPYGMAVSPTGDRLFITQAQSNSVMVFDTSSRALVTTIAVGAGPNGLAVTPDGRFLYVANNVANTLSKIDLTTFTAVETIPVNNSPTNVAIGPAGCVSVEPAATPTTSVAPATSVAPLPTTGSDAEDGSSATIGIFLVVFGGVLIAARRRRLMA